MDIFLTKKLKISRSQAQKMIANEQVLVNKKLPKKAGDNLSASNKIVILSKAKDPSHLETVDSSTPRSLSRLSRGSAQNDKKTKLNVKIIAETSDYIIIEKPAGMLVHPTMAKETGTLVDFIIKKWPKIKRVGDPDTRVPTKSGLGAGQAPIRPGIVHRLDKEASGIMVVAKTQKMFDYLKEQFKNRTIDKEYLALAHEQMARDWDEINFPIARSETSDRMAARPLSVAQTTATPPSPPLGKGRRTISPSFQEGAGRVAEGEKEAKTEFSVEKNFINFSLLRVKTHTGRMHQIRVHMLAFNHPLVGDPLYFQKKQKRAWDKKLGRLFLHSTKLGFTDLSGNKQEFISPLPKELEEFLKLLR